MLLTIEGTALEVKTRLVFAWKVTNEYLCINIRSVLHLVTNNLNLLLVQKTLLSKFHHISH